MDLNSWSPTIVSVATSIGQDLPTNLGKCHTGHTVTRSLSANSWLS